MLSVEMQNLITTYTAGMVATVNADGTPAVSPKATFVVVDERAIAFGNIRSPLTLANIRRHPPVEVCFLDVLTRKAVRVRGSASIHKKDTPDTAMAGAFNRIWGEYLDQMSHFVRIDISKAELIISPAYDNGASEAQLRQINLDKLNNL
ncbi:MAG: pyridoxamine 5'-phosphate oxidase family protein [Burkholderiaceae bacterium]